MEGANTYRNKKLIYSHPGFRLLSFAVYHIVVLVMRLVFPVVFGHRVYGRENLRNPGAAIAVSNHCTYLDPGLIAKAVHGSRIYFSIQQETVDIRGFGFFLRCLRGFPLPESRPMDIASAVSSLLDSNAMVHFFPEGVLFDYNQNIRLFHSGPFYFALKYGVPVIPITTVVNTRKIFGIILKKPWVGVTTVIGEPLFFGAGKNLPGAYRNAELYRPGDLRADAAEYAETVRDLMQRTIDRYGGDKNMFEGKLEHKI